MPDDRYEASPESSLQPAALLARLPGAVYRCRAEPGLPMQFVSAAIHAITGHAPDEFLGWDGLRIVDLIDARDREALDTAMADAIAAGRAFAATYRIRHRDGSERHVWQQGAAVAIDSDGTAVLEGYIADVTDQRNISERQAATEAEFRALFQSAPGCYLVLAPDTFRITAVSEAYLAATRTTRDQLLNRGLFDIFPDDPSEPGSDGATNLRRSLERVVRTRRADAMAVQRYPIPRPSAQGGGFEERFWSPLNSPVLAPDGRLAYIIHRVEDVTDYVRARGAVPDGPVDARTLEVEVDIVARGRELQRANEHLRIAQQRIQDTFDAAAVGIVMLDASGTLLLLNRAVCELLGAEEADLLFTDFTAAVVPADRDRLVTTMSRLLDAEGRLEQLELRVHRRDDSERWVRARLSAVRSAEELPRHVMAVLEDITEARAASERSRRNAALLRIAGHMSRVGGWALDLEEKRIEWSDEIFEILEFPQGDAPSWQSALALHPAEWRPTIVAALEGASRGERFDVELEAVTFRGRRLWVRVIGEPEHDVAGRVARVIGAFQDLSEVKAAERAAKELADRYYTVLEATQSGIWEWDLATDEVLYSGRFRALLGYDEEQFSSTLEALNAVLHPDDLPDVWLAMERHLNHGQPYHIEYRMRRADGTYRWFNSSGSAIRDACGRPVRMVGSILDVHDRRTAEAEVRNLADRLTSTFESITDALYTLDRDWCFSYLNGRAEDLLRRSREELLGRSVWAEFPATCDSIFEREYRKAVASGQSSTFVAYYPEPLNRWYDVAVYPSEQGLTVYFRDVTDEQNAAEAIRVSEERFRLLSQATNDAIWDWDLRTDALWWNEGYETLFGRRRDEVSPTIASWTDYVHPEDHSRVVQEVRAVIDGGGSVYSGEYRYQRADGTYAWVLDRGRVIRDAAGQPIRMIGGMTDLTERVRAEARVTEQTALLDEATDAIIVRDLEHRITFWSKGAEAIYGWSREEAIGQPIWQLVSTDAGAFHDATATVLQSGRWSGELEHKTKGGEPRTIFGRWTLMRDRLGAPQSVLAINSDVTEQRKVERQFLRSQRLESIGTLAGGIAHDLNNVLAPILMGVELLRIEDPPLERVEILDTIEESTRRGADMVRQVLAFAKGVEGQRRPTQVVDVCRDVAKIVRDTFPKNIRVQFDAHDAVPSVVGDATQLHQVILNLCLNARDAMPRGGDLRLAVKPTPLDTQYVGLRPDAAEGPHVLISVEDSGEGMTQDVLDKIFEPFFTTKEPGRGTGLGLSTSQAIIRSHGGFVSVYSDPGQGTRFHVYLPVEDADAAEGQQAPGQELPRGRGELVLVVDDEASVRQITRHTLEAFGYRVITAQDGADAISAFAVRQDDVAVVLTDMMMPVMDGPTMITVLLRMRPALRIIASSGLNANGRMATAAASGVKHFLPKPYTAETLLRTLRSVLDGTPTAER